jgi:hypothetical protein
MRKDLDKVARKSLRRKRGFIIQKQIKPDAVTLLQAINIGIAQTKQMAREGYDAEFEIHIDF